MKATFTTLMMLFKVKNPYTFKQAMKTLINNRPITDNYKMQACTKVAALVLLKVTSTLSQQYRDRI